MLILFIAAMGLVMLFGAIANEGNAQQSADPDDDGNGWEKLSCLAMFLMVALGLFFFLIGGSAGLAGLAR